MTKVFNNNDELLALVKKDGTREYIDFERCDILCNCVVDLEGVDIIQAGDIKVIGDIKARNIEAWNINVIGDIKARNIEAWNIKAINVKAIMHIKASDIDAWNIEAINIKASDIKAIRHIKAKFINYYAVCYAYGNILCKEIKGKRKNARHFCIDGEITIEKDIDN